MTTLIAVVVSYLIGAIPCGLVLTKLTGGGDIRESGSGNIGATNVYRTAGRTLGVITLLGDALKGFLPVLIAQQALGLGDAAIAGVAAAAFLGHCFPIYLGFKGGKGVATALGIYLALAPVAVLYAALVFVLLVWKYRYISLGSISAAALMPVLVWTRGNSSPVILATVLIGFLVIWRHKANIDRLLTGTENKFNL